jgi:cell division protein FtsI (penicillin-binding protein 3)
MDTDSGDILAMANLTSNGPNGSVVQSPRNNAVTDVYEPGSVNKLITIAGALEDGAIHVGDRFSVPDHYKVGNHVFSDHDPHAVVSWSPTDIMRESSNIGTILIAQKLGRTRLADYLVDFGFGTKTGIDFPGESAGLLRPASSWYSTDMGSIPIGQGVSVSALQMLAAYNAVANDGKYVAPRLVRATIDGQGVRHPSAEARTRRAGSVSTATAVTAMLEVVVKSGTGTLAQIPGYRVAGKTGTARKPAPGGKGYIDGAYMSSFAGFAPADHPAITVLVMLDEPTPIFGGLVAAPVFSELARAVLREMRVPPSSTAAAAAAAPVVGDQITRGDGDVPVNATTTTCCSQR